MHLDRLSLIDFKNYPEAELQFSRYINAFVGSNGVGKTNLLDAIYYLSFSKSFFNPIDSQNIRHEQSFFVIQGDFLIDDEKVAIHCGIRRGQKKTFKKNKKAYERLADHIGQIPLVMISPADGELIYGGSEIRRKFVDGVIAQYNRSYLDQLLSYQKAVQQRNALLKQFIENRTFDESSLSVWDMQLEQFGSYIHQTRVAFLVDFIPIFQKIHEEIAEQKEHVELVYDSQLNTISWDHLLEESRGKDRAVGYSTAGVHKDDLKCLLYDKPIKKFGSQGQQKSFLLALKLAQFRFIREKKGKKPILLLDDIFDKLDRSRVQALMRLVSNNRFGQTFLTDTNLERVQNLFSEMDNELKIFNVNWDSTIETVKSKTTTGEKE